MSLSQTVAKNTGVQVLGRMAVILFSLLTTALLTRLLGATGYGSYVFVIALVMFFVTIADWGTGMIFVREAAKKLAEEKKIYGNAFVFRFCFALFLFLVVDLLAFSPWFLPLKTPLLIASVLIVLITLKTTTHIIFQTKMRFEYMALADAVGSFVFLVMISFFAFAGGRFFSLALVVFLFVLANIVSLCFSLFWAGKLSKIQIKPERKLINFILGEAVPTGALLMVFSVYNRLDIFLLQAFKGAEAVGVYGLAYKVHDNLILGAAYLASALFPVLSSLTSGKTWQKNFLLIYRRAFDVLLVGGGLVAGIVFLCAPLIISLIGGANFTESALILRFLVFATFFAYLNHLTGYSLIVLGKQRVSLMIAVLALFFNLSLNLFFIPRFSFYGAAVVTVATESLVFFLTSFYLLRKFSLFPIFTSPQTISELIKKRGKIF